MQLGKRQIDEIRETLPESLQKFLGRKDSVELSDHLILVNKKAFFSKYYGKWMPTLQLMSQEISIPKITVDMGAVKFVVSGADIMRPGIVKFEDAKKDDFVCIVDEKNQKPLAVGIMLADSAEAEKSSSGKSVKNIHYVGDELWKKISR